MKIFLILFSFYLSFVGRSQIGFSDYYTDTITSDFQTLGPIGTINESLGILDQSFISFTNSRFFLADNYLNSNGSTIDYLNLVSKDERNYISALPHIGFGYVFGSQGAQHLLFRYGQVLPKNWVINTTIESTR